MRPKRLSKDNLKSKANTLQEVLGPEGFPKFWEACGKTGGAGFAALDAVTGEEIPSTGGPPHPKEEQKEPSDDGREPKAFKPTRETLTSREGKTVGISRGEMRALFLGRVSIIMTFPVPAADTAVEGCEPHVHWSHQVVGYEETPNGVRALFADGSKSDEGAMLVGGEGIYSKVAKQVSGGLLKTYDTGSRGIHGQAPTTAFKQLGEGVWRAADTSRADGG